MKNLTAGFLLTFLLSSLFLSSCKEGKHIVSKEFTNDLYTNYKSHFIEVDGLKVHYRDEGTGPTLVLIHGLGSSLHIWEAWVERLKDDYRIIRLDVPPFGLSEAPEEMMTIDEYMNFFDAFFKKLNIEKCYLAGSSLGGWLSWELAVAHPEHIRKVTLVAPAGYTEANRNSSSKDAEGRWLFKKIAKSGVPKWIMKRQLKKSYQDNSFVTDEKVLRSYHMMNREGNLKAMGQLLSADLPDRDHLISKVNLPTLIIWGEKDKSIDVKYAAKFHKDISDSKLLIFENAGHKVAEEKADTIVKVLRDFYVE